MRIGVPTEIKTDEYRVSLTPSGVSELVDRGRDVLVQRGAGDGLSITDREYQQQGAQIVPDAEAVFAEAETVLKVKEPQPGEVALLEPRHLLFTYLHLAANRELTHGLVKCGATCIAYETIESADGRLPLLAPMPEVAGRIAAQAGAAVLEKPQGARGVLMGGVPGVRPAVVLVIGGGVAGFNAAVVAAGMGADVTIFDRNIDRLRQLDMHFGGTAKTAFASTVSIEQRLADTDLVVGAVLVAGARAPRVGHSRSAGADADPLGPGRRLNRPRRMLRDLGPDDAFRPDVRGRRRDALLRGQHARRGADHVDVRADQCHDPLRRQARARRRQDDARRRRWLLSRAQRGERRCHLVHDALRPTDAQRRRAHPVTAATANGASAVASDGETIDRPVSARAKRVVNDAGAIDV